MDVFPIESVSFVKQGDKPIWVWTKNEPTKGGLASFQLAKGLYRCDRKKHAAYGLNYVITTDHSALLRVSYTKEEKQKANTQSLLTPAQKQPGMKTKMGVDDVVSRPEMNFDLQRALQSFETRLDTKLEEFEDIVISRIERMEKQVSKSKITEGKNWYDDSSSSEDEANATEGKQSQPRTPMSHRRPASASMASKPQFYQLQQTQLMSPPISSPLPIITTTATATALRQHHIGENSQHCPSFHRPNPFSKEPQQAQRPTPKPSTVNELKLFKQNEIDGMEESESEAEFSNEEEEGDLDGSENSDDADSNLYHESDASYHESDENENKQGLEDEEGTSRKRKRVIRICVSDAAERANRTKKEKKIKKEKKWRKAMKAKMKKAKEKKIKKRRRDGRSKHS